MAFKLACNFHALAKMAYGIIQDCLSLNRNPGNWKIQGIIRNGNSRIMYDDDKHTLNLTCVPLFLWENTHGPLSILSSVYIIQCVVRTLYSKQKVKEKLMQK